MESNHKLPARASSQILAAAREGWLSAKANIVPGLAIAAIGALLVAAYYFLPAAASSLRGLLTLRAQGGVLFTMMASAIGAGIIPGVYLMALGRSRRDARGVLDMLFTCLVWSATALAVDRFYVLQDRLWGSAVTLPIVVGKMLADQLVFTPLVGVQIPALGFRLRDLGYSLPALGRALRDHWIVKVTVPMLVGCWLTWVPGTLVIYALPLALQVPMMICFQCFFALVVAHASSRM